GAGDTTTLGLKDIDVILAGARIRF
ncbi:MAG: hypothetical protein RL291_1607, partial [Pseudomonadota bacterium]